MTAIVDGSLGFTAPVGAVYNGLQTGTAVASTSGTSIDFTGIPSWVKRITISFADVSMNATTNWIIQIGSSSGGIETTGYASCSSYIAPSVSVASSSVGLLLTQSSGASASMSGQAVLTLLNASTNLWAFSSSFCDYSAVQNMWGAGRKAISFTLDRVRITTTGGTQTFDAGSINIIYE
jgi:hypothetical protein